MAKRWLILAVVAVFALGAFLGACAPAAPAEYPAKAIKWVIPTPPGGGFDAYTRLIANYLPKYLPHQVEVVPENISGAAFIAATNHVYSAAPDGYTILTASLPDLVANQMMMGGEVAYDMRKLTPLGVISSDTEFIAVNPKTPYYTLKDLQQAKEVVFACTSVGGVSWLCQILITQEMGIKIKQVSGYAGAKDEILACIRGDTEAVDGSGPTIADPGVQGDLRLVFYCGKERSPLAPNVPTVVELGYPNVVTTGGAWWRVVYGPPNMPKGIAKVLENAIGQTLLDKDLLAEAAKQRREIIPGNAEELTKLTEASFSAVEKYLAVLKAQLGK